MCRIVVVFLALLAISPVVSAKLYKCTGDDGGVTFSDVPCASDAKVVKGLIPAGNGNEQDDTAIQNCVDYLSQNGRISDSEGIQIQSHRYEWVSVKDIGARRILHVLVNVRNEYGAYSGAESLQCLMMGDNLTVNPNPYELVE